MKVFISKVAVLVKERVEACLFCGWLLCSFQFPIWGKLKIIVMKKRKRMTKVSVDVEWIWLE